jgi:hypothetical protein
LPCPFCRFLPLTGLAATLPPAEHQQVHAVVHAGQRLGVMRANI